MKRIYITGDRSMGLIPAVQLVDAIIKDLVDQTDGDLAIGTGNCGYGVERAVRYIVPDNVLNLGTYLTNEDGSIDFETMFRELEPHTDEVIFLHMDPLSSHIGKALAASFPVEKVTLPLQESMAAGL